MRLFYSKTSPYARKVRIVILEKGLGSQIDWVETIAFDNAPEHLAANPLAKVPALILDNGINLCDSPIICEYLDSLTPKPKLFSHELGGLRRAAFADGILDAAVSLVMEGRRAEHLRWPFWQERQYGAISRTLAQFEREANELAQTPAIDTITLACALAYLDFRHPGIGWRDAYPDLKRWMEAFETRPSMQETAPPQ